MSKLFICTDVHWSEFASIVRTFGKKYSTRLEHCIDSLNWFENEAKNQGCDAEVFVGDFFDQPTLNAAEISALSEVRWNSLPKAFLVGNHEATDKSLQINSINALKSIDGFRIIDHPYISQQDDAALIFIPYFLDEDLKTLEEYGKDVPAGLKKIVFSHNSIKGMFFGRVPSTTGFEIPDIENNCDLFLNGHLHNGGKICRNGLNLGNFVGQNFNEDATKYPHCAYILDTDTLELTAIDNPYAFNFYQFEIKAEEDISQIDAVKGNAVVSVKCVPSLLTEVKDRIEHNDNICNSRVSIMQVAGEESTEIENIEVLQMNHLDEFVTFCKAHLNDDHILTEELSKICEG